MEALNSNLCGTSAHFDCASIDYKSLKLYSRKSTINLQSSSSAATLPISTYMYSRNDSDSYTKMSKEWTTLLNTMKVNEFDASNSIKRCIPSSNSDTSKLLLKTQKENEKYENSDDSIHRITIDSLQINSKKSPSSVATGESETIPKNNCIESLSEKTVSAEIVTDNSKVSDALITSSFSTEKGNVQNSNLSSTSDTSRNSKKNKHTNVANVECSSSSDVNSQSNAINHNTQTNEIIIENTNNVLEQPSIQPQQSKQPSPLKSPRTSHRNNSHSKLSTASASGGNNSTNVATASPSSQSMTQKLSSMVINVASAFSSALSTAMSTSTFSSSSVSTTVSASAPNSDAALSRTANNIVTSSDKLNDGCITNETYNDINTSKRLKLSSTSKSANKTIHDSPIANTILSASSSVTSPREQSTGTVTSSSDFQTNKIPSSPRTSKRITNKSSSHTTHLTNIPVFEERDVHSTSNSNNSSGSGCRSLSCIVDVSHNVAAVPISTRGGRGKSIFPATATSSTPPAPPVLTIPCTITAESESTVISNNTSTSTTRRSTRSQPPTISDVDTATSSSSTTLKHVSAADHITVSTRSRHNGSTKTKAPGQSLTVITSPAKNKRTKIHITSS